MFPRGCLLHRTLNYECKTQTLWQTDEQYMCSKSCDRDKQSYRKIRRSFCKYYAQDTGTQERRVLRVS